MLSLRFTEVKRHSPKYRIHGIPITGPEVDIDPSRRIGLQNGDREPLVGT